MFIHHKNTALTWCIYVITMLFMFSSAKVTEADGRERTIHFPKNRSVGEIFVRDRNASITGFDALMDWKWLGEAKGDVTIPADMAVRLNITKNAWQAGKPFEGLKSDDIQMLSFTQYKDADDSILKDLPQLAGLEVLGLSGTKITGSGLKYLTQLEKLKWLGLVVRYIGDDEIAPLADLTALESLNVRNTPISNYGLAHIGKIKTLRHLDVCGTSVDDDGLKHIKNLTSLRRLHFFRNNITDEGLKHLAGLTKMERLYLQNTQISDAGLVYLKRMKNLKVLDLYE